MKNNLFPFLNLQHTLKRAWVTCVLVCFIPLVEMHAQNLKPLANGLKEDVHCGCTDSGGNVYSVTRNKKGDSVIVNKYNILAKNWSVYARLGGTLITNQTYYTQCLFLNNRFYLTAVFKNSPGVNEIWEFSGGWKFINSIGRAGYGDIKSIVFNNKIYFAGMFDTTAIHPQVVAFNGTSLSDPGLPGIYIPQGPSPATMDVTGNGINDTLFMTYQNRVLFHTAVPSKWGIYYTHPFTLQSVAVANKYVYVSDVQGKISTLVNGVRKDSFSTSQQRINLKAYQNKLFLVHSKSAKNYAVRFGEFKNNEISYYFSNTYKDTTDVTLLNYNNQQLYYYSRDGFTSRNVNYNHIAQVRDTLKVLGIDTIIVRVFKDKNKNYVYDTTTNERGTFYIYETSNLTTVLTDNFGLATFYPLEDEDYHIAFDKEYLQGGDSCYGTPFSGALASRVYNSPFTKETLLMPVWRKTLKQRNLVLRSWGSNRARLLDTMQLNLDVFNKDCDNNTATVVVKVTLDPNTNFVSSVPAPIAKVNNVLTYSLSNIPVTVVSKIVLKITYPNTKYTVGQKVRHDVLLSTLFSEDTLDNRDSVVQKLVYSYDPNAKHCIPEGKITKDLKAIRYHIDFQNLGTDDARRVTVVDTLNLNMTIYEFRMVASSHNYGIPTLKGGNVVTWVFDNINLKPKSVNEKASKGFLIFDAMVIGALAQGDSIRNKAHIYFDYNEPVITNYAVIIRADNGGGFDEIKLSTLGVYPNPSKDILNIENKYSGVQTVHIYDAKGALVHSMDLAVSATGRVNTYAWAKGIYIVVGSSGESIKVLIE